MTATQSRPKLNSSDALKTQATVQMPLTYHHFNAGSGKPLLMFFHGYTDTAAGVLKRTMPDLDSRYEILAINGLFPTPQKIEGGWRQAYAWYFADAKGILIHPDVSAGAVSNLVKELGLEDRPKVLLGFSQGGYFLPFVSAKLKNVKKAFAMGAGYRPEDYPEKMSFVVDALHGTADEIISHSHAEETFEKFRTAKNPEGEFYSFPGLTHTMNDDSRALLKRKIDEVFA